MCLGEFLLQLAHDQVAARENIAAIRLDRSHDQPECCRLPGAIAADQADAFACVDREFGVAQYHEFGELQAHLIEAHE